VSRYSGGQEERPAELDEERRERVRMCLPEQWGDALLYLSGYAPEVFDAVMDTIDPCGQDADPEEDGGMVPFCEACGANVGIFLRRGPDWKHWRVVRGAVPPRPGAEAGRVSDDWDSRGPFEVFEPGHAPLLAWRPAGRPAGRIAAPIQRPPRRRTRMPPDENSRRMDREPQPRRLTSLRYAALAGTLPP